MTPDPAALREALEYFGLSIRPDSKQHHLKAVTSAARWALDLIEGGDPIEWCVRHNESWEADDWCNGSGRVDVDPCQFESQLRVKIGP